MPDSLPHEPQALSAAVCLSASAGLVDAVIYGGHGHVFAYAMTGNLVLLGVALASRSTAQIVAHLVPIVGFSVGVLAGKLLLFRFTRRAAWIAVGAQVALLVLFGTARLSPSSEIAVGALATAGGMIVTAIRRVGSVPFNVTFMTGNLRAMLEGAYDALGPSSSPRTPQQGAKQFRVVSLTCGGFLGGAALGGVASAWLGDHTLWIGALLLLAAMLFLRLCALPER